MTEGKACGTGQACSTGGDCDSKNCEGGRCQAARCDDVLHNGDETDVDCGGLCPKCEAPKLCAQASDCQSGVCGVGNVCDTPPCSCQDPTCIDGVTNGGEKAVDCGAVCGVGCDDGTACDVSEDCDSEVCDSNICAVPDCNDTIENGDETGPDCGGAACVALGKTCANDLGCNDNTDCTSGFCGVDNICAPDGCNDTFENGDETDVDCGGSCASCTDGLGCDGPEDCQSGICTDGTGPGEAACTNGKTTCCQAPSCVDTEKNQDESDVDCGGNTCPACADSKLCNTGTDCASGVCGVSNICLNPPCTCQPISCSDTVSNGQETGVDCGGPICPSCDPGQGCDSGQDCTSEVCNNTGPTDCGGLAQCCQTPFCGDGVNNATNESCDTNDVGGDVCTNHGFGGGVLTCNNGCDGLDFNQCLAGCGNDRVDADGELCDGSALGGKVCASFGFTGGILGCASDCGDYDLSNCSEGCGNGQQESGEECDGGEFDPALDTCTELGFDSGTVAGCNPDCTVDRSQCTLGCGNGELDAGEECDGALFAAAFDTCEEHGATGGSISSCNVDCTVDTSTCSSCDGAALESGELCDGIHTDGHTCLTLGLGFTDGTLGACNSSCDGFDTSACTTCGNNVLEAATETCDLLDLGGQSCVGLGWDGGTLGCAPDCGSFDENGCSNCPAQGCPNGQACIDGACVCPPGTVPCDNDCVSPKTDGQNCGGCTSQGEGIDCTTNNPAQVCSAGVCVDPADCQPPLVASGDGRCVDPDSDDTACGVAESDCTLTGEVCLFGTCVPGIPLDPKCSDGTSCTQNSDCPTPATDGICGTGCVAGGPPISTGTGGSLDCAGDLASVSFRWGVCACQDLTVNQGIVTDGYDSSVGPYPPANVGDLLGAGAATNADFAVADDTTIWGTLWAAGDDATSAVTVSGNPGFLTVKQSFLVGGNLTMKGGELGFGGNVCADGSACNADVDCTGIGDGLCAPDVMRCTDGSTCTVDLECVGIGDDMCHRVFFDATIEGDIAINGGGNTVELAGTLVTNAGTSIDSAFTAAAIDTSNPVSVVDPCDCDPTQLLDVTGIVNAHACDPEGTNGCTGEECCMASNNSNYRAGLDPRLLETAAGRLDLDCGHYYFTEISPAGEATIFVTGNVALHIAGDVSTGPRFKFALAPTAQLDVFIGGSLCTGQEFSFGSPNFPANARVYIAGGGAGCTPGVSFLFNQNVSMAGNIYNPFGSTDTNQPLLL